MIGQFKTGAEVLMLSSNNVYMCRCACGTLFTKSAHTLKVYMRDPRAKLRCSACYRADQRATAIANGTIARRGL